MREWIEEEIERSRELVLFITNILDEEESEPTKQK